MNDRLLVIVGWALECSDILEKRGLFDESILVLFDFVQDLENGFLVVISCVILDVIDINVTSEQVVDLVFQGFRVIEGQPLSLDGLGLLALHFCELGCRVIGSECFSLGSNHLHLEELALFSIFRPALMIIHLLLLRELLNLLCQCFCWFIYRS